MGDDLVCKIDFVVGIRVFGIHDLIQVERFMLSVSFSDVLIIFKRTDINSKASDGILVRVVLYWLCFDEKFPVVVNDISSLTILLDLLT